MMMFANERSQNCCLADRTVQSKYSVEHGSTNIESIMLYITTPRYQCSAYTTTPHIVAVHLYPSIFPLVIHKGQDYVLVQRIRNVLKIPSEFISAKSLLQQKNIFQPNLNLIIDTLKKLPAEFSETLKIFQIINTLPVSTASNERFFSSLKRVKSYLRSSMGERLSDLMVIAVEKEDANKIDLDEAVDRFSKQKNMDNSQDIRDLLDRSLSPVLTPEDLISSIGSSSTQILDENQLHDVSFASVSTINSQSRSTDVQHAASTGFSKISIKRRLLKGDGEFILVQHIGNSDVWKKFKNVMHIIPCPDDPDSPEQSSTDFVACVSCMELYGKTTSTATLGRHKCRMTSSQNTIETYGVFKNKKRLPTHVKDETINKCVKYCSLDIRPMSAIKGLGFCEISQFFLDTGAKYGYTDLNDILPHPTTVSRHIISTATKIRKIFFKEVYSLIDGKYCASTCDMWTDNYKKNNYMTITIHFIDDQWLLHNRILYTGQYPSHETKTGENIKKFMINAFTQLTEIAEGNNSSELMDNLTFVTDQGTNIVNALRSFKRLNCSAHLINTVLRNLFDIKFLSHTDDSGSVPLQPIIHLFNECKNLVKFMKSSGKNSQLSTVLVQEVETRWNTRLLMLESIEKSLPEIIKIHGEFFCRLQNINRDLLQSLITFLKIFKNASDELEGDKKPTIQKVVLFKCLIKNNLIKYANLEINNLDEDVEVNIDSIMKILGNKALTILDNKFQLSDVHEIAVFLWPKFKMLKMFSEENGERSRILGDIELRLLKFEIEDGEKRANSVTETNINSNSQELTSKEATMFSEWEDGVDERAQQSIYKYKKELESYREENYDISDDQILDFWSKQTLRFPYLSKLARQILAIPASSASSERSFSVAGRVIEQRRSCIDGSTVDAILFLNSHFSNTK
ncbi:hypothetical protein QTP88_023646 [Uroleucon formosanum]